MISVYRLISTGMTLSVAFVSIFPSYTVNPDILNVTIDYTRLLYEIVSVALFWIVVDRHVPFLWMYFRQNNTYDDL